LKVENFFIGTDFSAFFSSFSSSSLSNSGLKIRVI
jgi:hypothetical protein